MDFKDIVVKKPWGHEYLLYENENIALWHLYIKPGCSTSLHAHPNKKTGLIAVSGYGETSFLSSSVKLECGEKLMIRHGVFHSTAAGSVMPLELLEIETPNNKGDIIRLEDSYGRAGQPYETEENYTSDIERIAWNRYMNVGKCGLEISNFDKTWKLEQLIYPIYAVLEGGIFFNDYAVLGPGDVVERKTIVRLAKKFDFRPSVFLGISRA